MNIRVRDYYKFIWDLGEFEGRFNPTNENNQTHENPYAGRFTSKHSRGVD
jgi:hypothetical protein